MSELPQGWTWAHIADVVQKVSNIKPQDRPNEEFGYVDISAVCNSTYRITEAKYFKGVDAPSRAQRPIQSGDVLFSNVRTYLRNIAIVSEDDNVQVCSTGFTVLRSNEAVSSRYLFYYALSEDFISRVTPHQTGTHYPATSDQKVMSEVIALPPLNEQRRIVAKLDAAMARIEASRARLAQVPTLLKKFRQAVLSSACSGRLTADWRAQNPQATRLSHYSLASNDELPHLPSTWSYTHLTPLLSTKRRGMKTGPFGSALKKHEHQTTGVPVLGIENISEMFFVVGSKNHITEEKAKELSEYDARPGDILISRSGTVDEVCVVPEGLGEARISTNLIRVVLGEELMPIYFCFLFNGSPVVLEQVHSLCKGSTRDFLNQTILSSILFPLPPLEEQREIVRRVAAMFKVADSLEARCNVARAHVDRLSSATLARAFRGELVPQDPSDEPADALLQRVKDESAKPKEPTARSRKVAPLRRAASPRKRGAGSGTATLF